MTKVLSKHASFQKQLPLKFRMGYGWFRRKLLPHVIKDNDEFIRFSQWLNKSQWWTKDQLEEYQLLKLKELVEHAYENVPYYRRVFDEYHLKPHDINCLEDIQKIPILTKDDVRNNPDDFIARNFDSSRLRFWTTGGSSGQPLAIYHDKILGPIYECAFRYRQWGWAGYRFWQRKAWLFRDELKRYKKTGDKDCWDYNTHENELILAAREMSDKNMAIFVDKLKEFKPKYLSGIPSAIEILARYIQRNNIQDIQIEHAIFCLGEALYPWQRDLIESQFKCKIFAEYGMSEHAADAVECEEHQGYHVSMEYCIFELFDKDNQPINQSGVLGKVVGTGLLQYTMPFIRYVTDDLASFAAADCRCGRKLTLIEDFKGRSREFFVSKYGNLVPVQLLWTGRDPVWSKIKEMNFLQEVEGRVIARIVKSSQFSEKQIEGKLYEEMYKVLGEDEFNIEIAFVEKLPITRREVGREIGGKLSILEQRLPIGFESLN